MSWDVSIHLNSYQLLRAAEVEALCGLHRKSPQVRNAGAGSQKSDQSIQGQGQGGMMGVESEGSVLITAVGALNFLPFNQQ